jgi:hypothetical protein
MAGKKQAPPQQSRRAKCPCGDNPTDLMINLPQGSKYGTVQGNCCGIWGKEFFAGYPKSDQHLIQIAEKAWEESPRAGIKEDA